MSTLSRLCEWYAGRCNGDWEHTYGVSIETLDNPGWAVRIDLRELGLSQHALLPVDGERGEANWISCKVEQEVFAGHGGPGNLEEIVTVFLDWASRAQRLSSL